MTRNTVVTAVLNAALVAIVVAPVCRADDELQTDDEASVVRFADGAVELSAPPEWRVFQVPYGRELRLVVALTPPKKPRAMPRDGVWLTLHCAGGESIDDERIRRLMPIRLHLATDNLAIAGRFQSLTIDGHAAWLQEFHVESAQAGSAGRAVVARGMHLLWALPWGLVEGHAIAPADVFASRRAIFLRMMESLRCGEPPPIRPPVDGSVRDAAPILGHWRAFRGSMQIDADGRFVIYPDPKSPADYDVASPFWSRVEAWITGRFEARGDLLLVTWDDGSRTNYRWRLSDGALLLTDHDGRMSELLPVARAPRDQRR